MMVQATPSSSPIRLTSATKVSVFISLVGVSTILPKINLSAREELGLSGNKVRCVQGDLVFSCVLCCDVDSDPDTVEGVGTLCLLADPNPE
jgi:hypothetical protein